MKVVIVCASGKGPDAGRFKEKAVSEVTFVAHPDRCPLRTSKPCRPDDLAGPKVGTWRDVLVRYNDQFCRDGSNPNCLLSAGKLYKNRVYSDLVKAFGSTNVYILSAGWGLVRSDFLLPDYNITFSKNRKVPSWAVRVGCNRVSGAVRL